MVASLKPEVPIVDSERLALVYEELKGMTVKLDPNPIMYGPTRFNHRIAKVRALLSRVEQIFLQVSEDLHWFKRLARGKRTLFELERRELIVNDPNCRMGRSQGEREAIADVQLRAEIEEINDLNAKAEDLEILMVAIKSKRTDLKDIQGRMRDQIKMIDQDLNMGARWGKAEGSNPVSDNFGSSDGIDSLLASVDEDMGISQEEDFEEPATEVEGAEEVVEAEKFEDPSPVADGGPISFFEVLGPPVEPDLLPSVGSKGELPGDSNTSEEVDAFLGDFETEPTPFEGSADESSIEDLINSLLD